MSLTGFSDGAPAELRRIVQDTWRPAHERRRQDDVHSSEGLTDLLVAHDVENFVGVLEKRDNQSNSPLGYSTWLLTLDGAAYEAARNVRKELGRRAPDSPLVSPDFLIQYLSIGPTRSRISRSTEAALPLSADIATLEFVPKELLDAAEECRRELSGLPERVVSRRIRDALDEAKRQVGDVAKGGLKGAVDRMRARLLQKDSS